MKKIIILLVLMLVGCSSNEIDKLMKENDYTIIDVRTKQEYENGHVVDAMNIPYDILEQTIDIDKDKLIFVYCQSGTRSAIAFEILTNLGYEVYDLGSYNSIDLPKE